MHLGNKLFIWNKFLTSLFVLVFSFSLFVSPVFAASNDIVAKFTSETLNVLIGIGSLVATLFLIKGGYLYITSTGNPDNLEAAKRTLKNAILGLILVIGASFIASFLNNVFTTPINGTNPAQIALSPIEPIKPSGGLTQVIIDAVNGFIQNIVSSATKPIHDGIISFLTNTPSVVSNSVIFNYWLIMLGIVDSLFALGIAALGFQLMSASSFGFEELEFRQILPRIGLAFLAANMSIFLADWVIQVANTLVNAVIASTGGLDKAWVLNVIDITKLFSDTGNIILITLLLALLFVILCLVLLLMYVTRFILVAVGAVMGPFVFLLWAIPRTSGIAEVLIKSYLVTVFTIFVHVVVIQLASAFLATPAQGSSNSLISIIVAIGLLFTLIRIPQWLLAAVFVTSQGGRLIKIGGNIMNILANGRATSQSRQVAVADSQVKKPRRTLEV